MNIPKKASAEMNKGLEAYSKGDMEKAAAHFEKAIAEYPRYARAYDKLGAIAMKSSDRAKARELFGKSIQADDAFDVAALQKISARVARSWFLQKIGSGTRMRQLRMLPGLRNTRRSSTIGLIEP